MARSVNHAGYDRRLAVVKDILSSCGLVASDISTIAYDASYQWPFNNFLYRIQLAAPATADAFPGTQPGTSQAPPGGVAVLVLKLSNPAASGMNNANRVQNDVAVQQLVRDSMAMSGLPSLLPAIYAWQPATTAAAADERCYGWTMSALCRGVDLDTHFAALAFADKGAVLDQIAAVLAAIQAVRLPDTVTGFGALTYDAASGAIVSGEAALAKAPPQPSYAAWRRVRLLAELQDAAASAVAQGWHPNGVAARLAQALRAENLEQLLAGVDLHKKGLVHGDFTTNNVLFDPATKRITGVLDFDWSCVSHPFDEFSSLLADVGGNISVADTALNAAKLSGDFSTPPAGLDAAASAAWDLAKAWDASMQASGVVRPGAMPGVDRIRNVLRLQRLVCPYPLGSESALASLDDEEKATLRAKAEGELVQWLDTHGF